MCPGTHIPSHAAARGAPAASPSNSVASGDCAGGYVAPRYKRERRHSIGGARRFNIKGLADHDLVERSGPRKFIHSQTESAQCGGARVSSAEGGAVKRKDNRLRRCNSSGDPRRSGGVPEHSLRAPEQHGARLGAVLPSAPGSALSLGLARGAAQHSQRPSKSPKDAMRGYASFGTSGSEWDYLYDDWNVMTAGMALH